MSYILDALKKSDREYQLQQGHTVAQMYYASAGSATPSNRWALGLVCLLLLVSVVAYSLFASGLLQLRLPPSDSAERSDTMALATGPKVVPWVPAEPLDDATGQPVSAQDVARSLVSGELIVGQSLAVDTSSIDDAQPVDYASLKPLSEAMRERLGPLRFSLHVYSEQAEQRSIIINNRMMHEGEWLNSDWLLHAITDEGVIMRNGGSYYRVSVIADWQ